MESLNKILLNIIFLFFTLQNIYCQQCVGNGPCSCTFDDGSGVVDISSLASTGQPRFKDQPSAVATDAYLYSYNPCLPFTEGTCAGVSACQNSFNTEYYMIGDQTSAQWSFDGTNIQVYYSKTQDGVLRETFVKYVCDVNAKTPTMIMNGELGPAQFYMTVTTECACPNGCVDESNIVITVEAGISTGTILDILFIVGIFIYVAGGMTYMRVRNQATGVEMLPNRGFWSALPGLVKDGCVFVVSKVRSKRSTYDEV
ncbi:hypothetical protein SNE40_023229 [Patella caerulea]|uniref:MRH domain-containing protein n=1 Tax=Patella caerulea TaxID=87958 RepID=A0AAN8FY48_PATCE